MHDEVAVVEQRPLASRARGFGADRSHALLLQPAFDTIGDRVDLAVAASRQHELVVAERAELAHVQQDRFEAFFLEGELEGSHRAVETFGGWIEWRWIHGAPAPRFRHVRGR